TDLALFQSQINLRDFVFGILVRLENAHDCFNRSSIQSCTFCKVTGFIPPTTAEQLTHSCNSKAIKFIHRYKDGETSTFISVATQMDGFQQTIEHLAIVHLLAVAAAGDTDPLHRAGALHV